MAQRYLKVGMVCLNHHEKEVFAHERLCYRNPWSYQTYGEQNSVSNLSIHVRKGRIYGLLGRNGAGKTTTMRMLLGLTAPSSGDVRIFGKPLRGNEKSILPRIGSLIEAPGFYPNLTGTENLQIFADLRGLKSPKYIKGALKSSTCRTGTKSCFPSIRWA